MALPGQCAKCKRSLNDSHCNYCLSCNPRSHKPFCPESKPNSRINRRKKK